MTSTFAWRAAILVAAVLLAYASSLDNRYALDDDLVFARNVVVQRGVDGLFEIFTRDSYAGFYETMNAAPQLAGGRYRPLALATFAIEQTLFGVTLGDRYRALGDPIARMDLIENEMETANLALAPLRHVVSVLLYAASLVILLLLLEQHLLRDTPLVAFVATILFALHPVHTEVVANVKSRDEILSLLFIALTLLFACRYSEERRRNSFRLAIVFFALALLSKEYAVVLPLVLVVILVIVKKRPIAAVAREWLPSLGAVLVVYAVVRRIAAGVATPAAIEHQDLLNDPFLPLRLGEASGDVLATKISILLHYLRLLVWPHPLSADYSYATFPFADWNNGRVWLSIAVHGVLLAATYIAWRRRHVLAIAGVVYFAFLFPVSNLPYDIGATLGERLVYHASLGFAVACAWILVTAIRSRAAVFAVTAAIALTFGTLTFLRGRDWYDDTTLFLHDVKVVPKSALANGNAGGYLMEDALRLVRARRQAQQTPSPADVRFIREKTDRARPYLETALTIHPRFANTWVNLGLLHWTREEYDDAADAWEHAAAILPSHPILFRYGTNFRAMANVAAQRGDLESAIAFYGRAIRVQPGDTSLLRDLAGSNFVAMHFAASRAAFDRLLAVDPANPDARRGRNAAAGLEELERAAVAPGATREQIERYAAALESNTHPAFRQRAASLRNVSR